MSVSKTTATEMIPKLYEINTSLIKYKGFSSDMSSALGYMPSPLVFQLNNPEIDGFVRSVFGKVSQYGVKGDLDETKNGDLCVEIPCTTVLQLNSVDDAAQTFVSSMSSKGLKKPKRSVNLIFTPAIRETEDGITYLKVKVNLSGAKKTKIEEITESSTSAEPKLSDYKCITASSKLIISLYSATIWKMNSSYGVSYYATKITVINDSSFPDPSSSARTEAKCTSSLATEASS